MSKLPHEPCQHLTCADFNYQNPLLVTEELVVRTDWWRQPHHWPTGKRLEVLTVSVMVGLFVLLHSIWFIRVPGDLDAFNFVLGVRDFDVAQHRPHPPGAPVYVAAAKTTAWAWQSLRLPGHPLAGHEAAALGALSLIAGMVDQRLCGSSAFGTREK